MSRVRFQNPWCVGAQQDLFDLRDTGETKSECRLYIQDMLGSLTSSSVNWIADYPMEYRPEYRSLFSISRTSGES